MHFSKFADCVTLFLVMILDLVFTVVCQPSYYWENYEHHEELSPMGSVLLLLWPKEFVVSFVLYLMLVVYYGVAKFPQPWSHAVFTFFLLGHSLGSASWLTRVSSHVFGYEVHRWYASCGYLGAIALVYGLCLCIFREPKLSTDSL